MKKIVILLIVVLLVIAGAITYISLNKEPKSQENTAQVEEIDRDEDIDLDSIPLELTDEEKNKLNKTFEEYDGKTLGLEETKELIDLIIDTNESFIGDGKRFVSIDDGDYSNEDNKLFMRCLDANPYYGGDNTKEDVEDAKAEMENFKESLEDGNYEMTIIKGRNIVVEIRILKV